MFSSEVIDIMLHYDWPGNVRQLKNAVEYMAVMNIGNMITKDKLPEQLLAFSKSEMPHKKKVAFDEMVEQHKKEIIQNYYNFTENIGEMAALLGISQATAYRLVKKYISKPEE